MMTPGSGAATVNDGRPHWWMCAADPACIWTDSATQALQWRYRKTGWLWMLACAHRGQPLPRADLAHWLWPQAEPAQARSNLRVLLADLQTVWRNAQLPELWAIEREQLCLSASSRLRTELDTPAAAPDEAAPQAWRQWLATLDPDRWCDTLPLDVGPHCFEVRQRMRQRLARSSTARTLVASHAANLPSNDRADVAVSHPPALLASAPLQQALEEGLYHLVLMRIEPDLPIDIEPAALPLHPGQAAWRRAIERLSLSARAAGASVDQADAWGMTLVWGLGSAQATQRWRALEWLQRASASAPGDEPLLRVAAAEGRSLIQPAAPTSPLRGWQLRLLHALALWAEPGWLACPAHWAELLDLAHGLQFDSVRFRDFTEPVACCSLPLAALPEGLLPTGTGPAAPRFVGRAAQWNQLQQLWHGQATESPQARPTLRGTLIEAPVGYGKTRLAAEFARWVAEQGSGVWWIAGQPELAHIPWRALHQTVSRHWTSPHSNDADSVFPPGFFPDPAAEPALKRFVQTAAVAQTDLENLASALAHWWTAAAGSAGPALLVVDDVQWLDAASCQLVCRALARAPAVLPVLTLRSDPSSDAAATLVDPALKPWQASVRWSRLSLPALGDADAYALVESAVRALSLSAPDIQRQISLGRGIPLLLLSAARGGTIGHDSPVAAHLEAWINLTGGQRSSLRLAARLGMRFAMRDLIELLGESEALQTARDALHHGLLLRRDAGHLAFFHPALREQLLASSTPAQRQTESALCAEHFRRLGDLARAAGFWLDAQQPKQARQDLCAALQQAMDQDDLNAALTLASRLSDIGPPDGMPGLQARIHHIRALLARHGYANPQARQLAQDLQRCMHAHRGPLDHATLFFNAAFQYLHDSGISHDAARRAAQAMQDQAREPSARLVAHWATANAGFWQGQLHQANPWYERTFEVAATLSRAGRERYFPSDALVFASLQWAWGQWMLGHADACRSKLQAITQLVQQPGTRAQDRVICDTIGTRLYELLEDRDARRAAAHRAREQAETEGYELWLAFADSYCQLIAAEDGQPIDIQQLYQRHRAVMDNYPVMTPLAWWLAARALKAAGQPDPALSLIDAALGRMQAEGGSIIWCDALWLRAELLDQLQEPRAAESARRLALARAEAEGWLGWLRSHHPSAALHRV